MDSQYPIVEYIDPYQYTKVELRIAFWCSVAIGMSAAGLILLICGLLR